MATDLTRENCETATQFYHKTVARITAGGKPVVRFSCRRNGKTKTWKTRPDEFKIPVKRGLYIYGYITHKDYSSWTID